MKDHGTERAFKLTSCSPDDEPNISFGQDHPDLPLWFDDGPGDPICKAEFPRQPR